MAESGATYPERVTPEDFCRIFDAQWADVPPAARAVLRERNLSYRKPNGRERDEIIVQILKRLDAGDYWVSGEDKQAVWERGWSENLREFESTGDLSRLWPKFLSGKSILRMDNAWIYPQRPDFEFDLVDVYRRWVFARFFRNCRQIFEFGCGSCQHIPVLTEMFPDAKIHGLDWAKASSQIIAILAAKFGWNVQAHSFNLYAPDESIVLGDDAGVLTIGTLEQTGSKFDNFLRYLCRKKPQIVVHLETIDEFYDASSLSGYLARRYDRARNYLAGYLAALRRLESEGTVEIKVAQHVPFGSMYHDSYSLLAWRPL